MFILVNFIAVCILLFGNDIWVNMYVFVLNLNLVDVLCFRQTVYCMPSVRLLVMFLISQFVIRKVVCYFQMEEIGNELGYMILFCLRQAVCDVIWWGCRCT